MTLASAVLGPAPRHAAPQVLAVVLDRAHARLFAVTDIEVTEVADLRSPASRGGRFHSDRHGAPGGGEESYHHRVEEEEQRHFAVIVGAIRTRVVGRPEDLLLLAGPGPAATVFQRFLPPELKARVIGREQLNPLEVTPAIVAGVVRDAVRHHRHVVERTVMTQIEEGLGTGLATNGVRETLRALALRKVRTLILRPHTHVEGFRCLVSGRLALAATDCRGEGQARPVADLFQAAAREAERQDAEVMVIRDPPIGRGIEGLAALLRFP